MELNRQGLSLIEYLYDNGGQIQMSQICKYLSLSKRSLLYQVDKMNDFLRENQLSEIVSTGQRIMISVEEQKKVEKILFSQEIKNRYFLSAEERLALITIVVAVSHIPFTTESLCQLMDISKNTLVTDIAALKKKLTEVGLFLHSSNKTGYEISGDETTLRFYVIECLRVFFGNKYSKYYILSVYQELYQKGGFSESYSSLYRKIMNKMDMFADQNSRYTQEALEEIYLHITLIILRKKVPDITIHQEGEHTKQEYQLARAIMLDLQKKGFSVQKKNENYLTEILLSSRRQNNRSHIFVEENLIEFTMRLVDNFEKLAMIRLESKKEYINKLLLHIRPMYYRLKYGIKIHNILNQEIQEKYTMFFHLTKKAIELTDQKYFNELSDDEVSYLCIYFAGWMNQNVSEIGKEDAPYKILLVVSDGNSTSSLIQLQLVNLLKPLHFSYDVVSSRQFMSSMAEKYALVVGDIPRENTFSHVIPVSAILTESQRNRILQWSIRFSNMNNDDDLTRLYDIIQMHCTIHDEEILKVKLFSFLNENSGTESSQIPSLLQIMKVNDLFLFSEKMDIDQILFVMSRDFVIKKIVKALYPVNILHLLQTMGAYGEISKGVLLLHAEDVSYCNGLGIRIGNLEYPLRLSGNPHEIHTIILLSTPDKLKHLRILKNLSQLFRNADFLNRLEKGMFSTKEQMYKKIAQILSTEE